jgi:hypothetical protein
MFRLPREVLDPETAGQYCYTDTASVIETDSHLILNLYVDQEEADDYWDEPGGQLAAMVQARSELAAGDLRLLYLAWLLALQSDEVDDEAAEQRRREAEARRRAAQAAAYAKHLDQLATRTEAAWEKAAELIETRKPRDYDMAASLLRDLQALADRQEGSAAFRKRFLELRAQHQRKPSLLDRFDQVGLPS